MEHWSAYWQTSGVLNSFAEGNVKDGYSGQLKQFWDNQFKQLPEGATIVDIGTGNGALAILAYDYGRSHQRDFVVEGIDAAMINPAKQFEQQPSIAKKLKAIRFHSVTPVEQLPYGNASIDAAVSQFGFEYSDRKQALTALAAALKPGGKAVFVCHHSNSALSKQSQAASTVLQYCLEISPLFQQADLYFHLARQAIPQLGLDGWFDYSYQGVLKRSIQWTMDILRERFNEPDQQSYVNDVIARVARLLQAQGVDNASQLIDALGIEYQLLNDHRLRIDDQIKASLSKKDISALKKQSEQLSLGFAAEELAIDDKLFGWVISLTKSA